MIITHASKDKITKIENDDIFCECRMGCLFFGEEDNTYNLAGECNYQYNLEVENVLRMRSLNFKHNYEDCQIMQNVFEDMRIKFGFDESVSDDELSELLDNSLDINDYDTSIDDDMKSWVLQQFQGILAHKLGYDCAESEDEQGAVYIAFCVDRELELQEVVI
ncbi:hypothetical protein ETN89_19820 (plasmid) [Photobacterium damselae subsp. damselae]|uniref:hypothetical protein n=1 Tax=Photobacterium damselae TaxID=38293 RepID=UPI000A2FD209|nr:hypothetical protein [Photobacterium damselae]ARR51931.1 hypothetical protein CAY62_21265 [Photobacterium damselae subsp. damselae]QAY37516.1 hypothetical protein ETN89_19820 [Photobacterium damselae subsp. damselae]